MSYHDGWAAIHLEMPARVPRTEYSAETVGVRAGAGTSAGCSTH